MDNEFGLNGHDKKEPLATKTVRERGSAAAPAAPFAAAAFSHGSVGSRERFLHIVVVQSKLGLHNLANLDGQHLLQRRVAVRKPLDYSGAESVDSLNSQPPSNETRANHEASLKEMTEVEVDEVTEAKFGLNGHKEERLPTEP